MVWLKQFRTCRLSLQWEINPCKNDAQFQMVINIYNIRRFRKYTIPLSHHRILTTTIVRQEQQYAWCMLLSHYYHRKMIWRFEQSLMQCWRSSLKLYLNKSWKISFREKLQLKIFFYFYTANYHQVLVCK